METEERIGGYQIIIIVTITIEICSLSNQTSHDVIGKYCTDDLFLTNTFVMRSATSV